MSIAPNIQTLRATHLKRATDRRAFGVDGASIGAFVGTLKNTSVFRAHGKGLLSEVAGNERPKNARIAHLLPFFDIFILDEDRTVPGMTAFAAVQTMEEL